jgi:hypothetical protein
MTAETVTFAHASTGRAAIGAGEDLGDPIAVDLCGHALVEAGDDGRFHLLGHLLLDVVGHGLEPFPWTTKRELCWRLRSQEHHDHRTDQYGISGDNDRSGGQYPSHHPQNSFGSSPLSSSP